MPLKPMYPMSFIFSHNGVYYYTTYCCDPNDPHDSFAAFRQLFSDEDLGCPIIASTAFQQIGTSTPPGTARVPQPTVKVLNSHTMHIGFGDGLFPPLPKDMAGVQKNGALYFGPFCREITRIPNVRLVTSLGDSVEDRTFTVRKIEITWPAKRQILIAESARELDESAPDLKRIAITGLKTETDGKSIEIGLALTEDREPIVIVNQFRYS